MGWDTDKPNKSTRQTLEISNRGGAVESFRLCSKHTIVQGQKYIIYIALVLMMSYNTYVTLQGRPGYWLQSNLFALARNMYLLPKE